MILRTETTGRYEVRCGGCGEWGVVLVEAGWVEAGRGREAAREAFILKQGWREDDPTAAKPDDIICPNCVALQKVKTDG